MTDAAREFIRLLEAWDNARKVLSAMGPDESPASRAKAQQILDFSHAKLAAFQSQQAEAFDVMVRCKKATCPDGDTTLEMVLGDHIRQAIDRRVSLWQDVATALTREVEQLKREVRELKRQRQAVPA